MIDRIAFWQHVLGLPPEEQACAAAEMGVTRDALVKAARSVLGLPEEHPLAVPHDCSVLFAGALVDDCAHHRRGHGLDVGISRARPSAAVLDLFERRRDNILVKECMRITTELKSKHSYPATMPAAPNVSDYEAMKKLLRDLEAEDEKTRAERLKAQAEQLAKLMGLAASMK